MTLFLKYLNIFTFKKISFISTPNSLLKLQHKQPSKIKYINDKQNCFKLQFLYFLQLVFLMNIKSNKVNETILIQFISALVNTNQQVLPFC